MLLENLVVFPWTTVSKGCLHVASTFEMLLVTTPISQFLCRAHDPAHERVYLAKQKHTPKGWLLPLHERATCHVGMQCGLFDGGTCKGLTRNFATSAAKRSRDFTCLQTVDHECP